MDQRKNVTIYDIARRAGTSASTVGAVLNGSWRTRRISEARAKAIRNLADEMGYSVNLQARALRKETSKIIGMIIPMHDNRYFSTISQLFEQHARKRGLFPIVSSTLRDTDIEIEAVGQLLNYRVDSLVCTGATDPDSIFRLCAKHRVQTYNIDLPGTLAPSVISDNYTGAKQLTETLLERVAHSIGLEPRILFIGGRPNDHNTRMRVQGYRDALADRGINYSSDDVLACGYAANKSEAALARYFDRSAKLPQGIFVNSTIALEGVMRWFSNQDPISLDNFAFGCFDWDPFAALINPNVIMVKQDAAKMVSGIFDIMDARKTEPDTLLIPTLMIG